MFCVLKFTYIINKLIQTTFINTAYLFSSQKLENPRFFNLLFHSPPFREPSSSKILTRQAFPSFRSSRVTSAPTTSQIEPVQHHTLIRLNIMRHALRTRRMKLLID